jgi:hypothetical protein
MVGILIISHGRMAEALISSVQFPRWEFEENKRRFNPAER